ncbi:TerB family tellurite resistance protein [Solimonas marina]|uniref:TerB family tellurite resistance protein n=1 Tax=Solimonas marina TaxID=2714601 RepID=A0A969W6N1_9GAMM|nr:TerB family tellurite resistance protein [Solimonas marina]NKF21641.1 TerB family tellurite resistance protein [Solimonas marina]
MSFLSKLTASFAPPPKQAVDRHLAMAVLLLETARADFERSDDELAVIREQLAHGLGLDPAQTDALLQRAADSAGTAVSLHSFVAALNDELDADGKRELLLWLWQVALADGRIEPREEALIRQLADLLFVPHADFIRTRMAAGG